MSKSIKKIGVFTSGGDAPGMNAAIRAVVRASYFHGLRVVGIRKGYEGMIRGDVKRLKSRSVSGIIHRGGTILKSARSQEFRTEEGRKKAWRSLQENEIDALIAIGGDGTFTGAHAFFNEFDIPIIGIPGTIDNDLTGTDYTIGYDTATNTAVQAIDKIRDTASSHNRLFFIEVMGRDAGFIAVRSALAGGAEAVLIPEEHLTTEELIKVLETGSKNNKTSSLVIVAEGGKSGSATEIAQQVSKEFSYYDTKVTILGHIQRGGSPTCFDRVLASRLGVAAVEGLIEGQKDVMVGVINNKIVYTPLEEAIQLEREIDAEVLRISKILSI